MEAGTLSDDECREVRATDFVARGRRREDGAVVYLVVEVSWDVGVSDVERAARRAAILASAGIEALPVVAGASVIPDAERLARERGVRSVVDGVTSAVA